MRRLQCSVVMLVEDSETDFTPYLDELASHLWKSGHEYELLVAVNGQGSFVRTCLRNWHRRGPAVRIVELPRKIPTGICLQTVLPECRGEILIVCGPYRQIDGEGLDALMKAVADGEADLAFPWRQQRVDPPVNQWQSRIFNYLVGRMTETDFHDLSGTLRVVRRQVLEESPLYGDLYRYLPLLAGRRGFRVEEIPVRHAEERGRVGFYGMRRYVSRFVDLLTMRFNLGFTRKPLRYFGMRGICVFLAGIACMVLTAALKLAGRGDLGDSPALMIGLVLMLTGSGIWGVGLLGEILAFTLGRKRKDYIVERILE